MSISPYLARLSLTFHVGSYHDWEHFSSIRNLDGPHSGPPNVRELSVDSVPHDLPSVHIQSSKPPSRARARAGSVSANKLAPVPVSAPKPLSRPRRSSRAQRQSVSSSTVVPVVALAPPPTPADIPLPISRSASPPALPSLPGGLYAHEHEYRRSPKRSFDESSGSSEVSATSTTAAKRTRRGTAHGPMSLRGDVDADMDADIDVDGDNGDGDADLDADDADTPSLSETASLSPVSSPSPSPSPPPDSTPPRRLTKRERKAAGLPRQRGGVGKIVIPGGRFRTADATTRGVSSRVDADGEWARNGTGRVDVRGFRELRI